MQSLSLFNPVIKGLQEIQVMSKFAVIMASHFYIFFIIRSVFYVKTSAATTGNSSLIRASYVYNLDSGRPSTWYNNNSVIMDGWKMRVFLLRKQPSAFYCGFYCNGSCTNYLFSIVSVTDHSLLWSANSDRPVKENASIQLTRDRGLVLRDSDGSSVWLTDTLGKFVTGMNLTEEGKLVIFDNQSSMIWQTPPKQPSFAPRPSPAPENRPEAPSGDKKKKNLALIISVSSVGGFIIICVVVGSNLMLRKKRLEENGEENMKQVPGMPKCFLYEELEIATENFKETLGSGGFGSVFKGVLADGTNIAAKRLDKLGQGMREFLAEVKTIGSLNHFNLVRLVGFCAEKTHRLLVYEYMINGSLNNWIFNNDTRRCLDWQTRKKIILDIAKGLAYLHEDCRQKIIHHDIKPHNILLDENFNAKVSDFGLSRLIDADAEDSQVLTVRGTPGYIAPEWQQLKVTVKLDVYSFGIVLLEIVSKRKNLDRSRTESSLHLLHLLQTKAEEDHIIGIVDDLDEEMENNREEVEKMIKIGVWCLQNDYTKRPLMSTVVKVLEGVMEVDPNIEFRFSFAMASAVATVSRSNHINVSDPPQPSLLSAAR